MDKNYSTQKKHPLLFFPHSKKRKKKKRKKNVHRAAAAARFFSARQPLVRRQHPVVDHRRGVTSAVRGRDERRDPNRACRFVASSSFSLWCCSRFFFDDKKRVALVMSAMNESARWRSNRDSIVRRRFIRSFALASNIGAGLKRSATPSRRTQTRGARRDDDDGKSTSEEKEASRRVVG